MEIHKHKAKFSGKSIHIFKEMQSFSYLSSFYYTFARLVSSFMVSAKKSFKKYEKIVFTALLYGSMKK